MLELNKIYNMDCVEGMKLLSDNSIDLTVTSPPYDNIRTYGGDIIWNDSVWLRVIEELYRVTADGGVVVWVVGDMTVGGSETGTSFKQALAFKDVGFKLHDTMIYHRNSPPLTHRRYEQYFEYMFVLVKGKLKTFNPILERKTYLDNRKNKSFNREKDGSHSRGYCKGDETMKIKNNVWHYLSGGGHSTKDKCAFRHPAIFPEQLALDHITSWSVVGDIVLDPFVGSGTTAKMCIKSQRNFIGFEISKEYCDLANERIDMERRQVKLWEV